MVTIVAIGFESSEETQQIIQEFFKEVFGYEVELEEIDPPQEDSKKDEEE